ncbi:hypothetical protein ACFFX0_01605 [Citricoccus parietis]|uniref:Uncharacterized protein n=1 Tax=Citricoccus parietis TaxID=592307 RepID=A0ABV5FUL2_9MICC
MPSSCLPSERTPRTCRSQVPRTHPGTSASTSASRGSASPMASMVR